MSGEKKTWEKGSSRQKNKRSILGRATFGELERACDFSSPWQLFAAWPPLGAESPDTGLRMTPQGGFPDSYSQGQGLLEKLTAGQERDVRVNHSPE